MELKKAIYNKAVERYKAECEEAGTVFQQPDESRSFISDEADTGNLYVVLNNVSGHLATYLMVKTLAIIEDPKTRAVIYTPKRISEWPLKDR